MKCGIDQVMKMQYTSQQGDVWGGKSCHSMSSHLYSRLICLNSIMKPAAIASLTAAFP